jgi:hypothetical protein
VTLAIAQVLYMAGSVCFFVGTLMLFGQAQGWWS